MSNSLESTLKTFEAHDETYRTFDRSNAGTYRVVTTPEGLPQVRKVTGRWQELVQQLSNVAHALLQYIGRSVKVDSLQPLREEAQAMQKQGKKMRELFDKAVTEYEASRGEGEVSLEALKEIVTVVRDVHAIRYDIAFVQARLYHLAQTEVVRRDPETHQAILKAQRFKHVTAIRWEATRLITEEIVKNGVDLSNPSATIEVNFDRLAAGLLISAAQDDSTGATSPSIVSWKDRVDHIPSAIKEGKVAASELADKAQEHRAQTEFSRDIEKLAAELLKGAEHSRLERFYLSPRQRSDAAMVEAFEQLERKSQFGVEQAKTRCREAEQLLATYKEVNMPKVEAVRSKKSEADKVVTGAIQRAQSIRFEDFEASIQKLRALADEQSVATIELAAALTAESQAMPETDHESYLQNQQLIQGWRADLAKQLGLAGDPSVTGQNGLFLHSQTLRVTLESALKAVGAAKQALLAEQAAEATAVRSQKSALQAKLNRVKRQLGNLQGQPRGYLLHQYQIGQHQARVKRLNQELKALKARESKHDSEIELMKRAEAFLGQVVDLMKEIPVAQALSRELQKELDGMELMERLVSHKAAVARAQKSQSRAISAQVALANAKGSFFHALGLWPEARTV